MKKVEKMKKGRGEKKEYILIENKKKKKYFYIKKNYLI